MLEHVSHHPNWAKIIYKEIVDDNSDWFHPTGSPGNKSVPGDFEFGRMRFLNRNLNYFYFENMLSHAVKNEFDFNLNYSKSLEFCESIRSINKEAGPFGRMCVWKLQGLHYLLPHKDNWEYHRHITRYIFCVSDHSNDDVLIKICGEEVTVTPGLLFSFHPAIELHEFVNKTNRDFYFLGFDYWIPEKLSEATQRTNVTKDTVISYDSGFGGRNRNTKFISKE
jgi:hypothetical protein